MQIGRMTPGKILEKVITDQMEYAGWPPMKRSGKLVDKILLKNGQLSKLDRNPKFFIIRAFVKYNLVLKFKKEIFFNLKLNQ